MDELVISGKKYISSKRASQLTGYAKDYVGQLARGGKIPGTRVGRAWYLEEEALLRHKTGPADTAEVLQAKSSALPGYTVRYPSVVLPKTWGDIRYSDDDGDLMPKLRTENVSFVSDEKTIRNKDSSDALAPSLKSNPLKLTLEPKSAPEETFIDQKTLSKKDTSGSFLSDFKNTTSIEASIVPVRRVSMPLQDVIHKTPLEVASFSPRRRKAHSLGQVSLAALCLGVLLFSISTAGLFTGIEIGSTREGSYTAGVILSSQYFTDFMHYARESVQPGFSLLLSFFFLLKDSFWSFFSKGLEFIKALPGLV